jgi:tetratricopeptide (TPR) repeat protein
MRSLWIGLALAISPISSWAQMTNEEWANCWQRGTPIPAQIRVENCTQLIERGERAGLPRELIAVAYSNRGIAYHELNRTEEAITDYTRAIELNPRWADAYYNRGNAYGEKHLYDRAITDYTVAIALAPDVPTYDNRGWTYEKIERPDLAIADYRQALSLDPSNEYAQSALKRLGVSP